jgi:hypothetical protein
MCRSLLYSLGWEIFGIFLSMCFKYASVIDQWMSVEHWLNDTDRGKRKYSEENLPHCHFGHHRSYTE